MKKNILRKDFIIEIKKTMGRFVSIFFIVALGVAFYSGIRASEPSMRITADQYFDEGNGNHGTYQSGYQSDWKGIGN